MMTVRIKCRAVKFGGCLLPFGICIIHQILTNVFNLWYYEFETAKLIASLKSRGMAGSAMRKAMAEARVMAQ
jgi:hypothetical protein